MAATIAEIIQARLSRRAALKGIGAGSAFGLFGCSTLGSPPSPGGDGSAPLEFEEVGRSTDGTHHVAAGYTAQVLIRQGDPIRRGGPQYRPGQQTPAEQAQQFGTEKGSTFDKPSTRWPDFREDTPPRSSVLAITRDDGGEIGG